MRKIKIKLNRRGRMIVTVLMCSFLLFTIVPRAKTIYDLSIRKQQLLQEKAKLTEINAQRQKTLANVDSPAGVERIAREQLGMVKPGEKTIVKVISSE